VNIIKWTEQQKRTPFFCFSYVLWVRIKWQWQLENMAIANALQLEAARATPAFSRSNYDAVPSLTSLNLSIAFLLLIHYFTPWPWPLTFKLEHLQRIVCDVMKLCTNFERNRTICGGVIAISVFDLITLNMF